MTGKLSPSPHQRTQIENVKFCVILFILINPRGVKTVKRIIWLFMILVMTGCSNKEVEYEGAPLHIAVLGDALEVNNENIHFEEISIDGFTEDVFDSSTFDAVMITPSMFNEASDDRFVDLYRASTIPVVFFDSEKRHIPFTNDGLTYETAHVESLINGSHTTIYLHNTSSNQEDAWYFYLEKEDEMDVLYKNIFEQIANL